jgi:predicted nucleotidyltransferase
MEFPPFALLFDLPEVSHPQQIDDSQQRLGCIVRIGPRQGRKASFGDQESDLPVNPFPEVNPVAVIFARSEDEFGPGHVSRVDVDAPPAVLGKSPFDGVRLQFDIRQGSWIDKLLKNRKLHIHTVVVLGSRVKRSWKPQSDVDVTIIAEGLPREATNILTRRLGILTRRIVLSDRPLYLGIEPSGCCSRQEFLDRLEQFDVTVLDAVFYGRLLFD